MTIDQKNRVREACKDTDYNGYVMVDGVYHECTLFMPIGPERVREFDQRAHTGAAGAYASKPAYDAVD